MKMKILTTMALFYLAFAGVSNAANWKVGISRSAKPKISWNIIGENEYIFKLDPEIKCGALKVQYIENPFSNKIIRSRSLRCVTNAEEYNVSGISIQYTAQGYGDNRDYGCENMHIFKKDRNYELYICYGDD